MVKQQFTLVLSNSRKDADKISEDAINEKIDESVEQPIWELNAAELDTARPDWEVAQVKYLIAFLKLCYSHF